MGNSWNFIDTSFIAAEQNVHIFKHAHIVCGALWMFISPAIPALAFSHTISPGDCSLFSKGNVKVSLRRARKFLQVNRRKLSQPLCGCFPAKAVPFLFAGLFALRTKAQSCSSLKLLLLCSVSPSYIQPLLSVCFPARDARRQTYGYPGWQSRRCASSPSPSERMGALASIPLRLACRL